MTIESALSYIERRMSEIGVGKNYFTQLKHFVLTPLESIEIDADNQYFILLDEMGDILIQSDFGIYDLTETTINELKYEHQGKIIVQNYSAEIKHVRFMQVIPKN